MFCSIWPHENGFAMCEKAHRCAKHLMPQNHNRVLGKARQNCSGDFPGTSDSLQQLENKQANLHKTLIKWSALNGNTFECACHEMNFKPCGEKVF